MSTKEKILQQRPVVVAQPVPQPAVMALPLSHTAVKVLAYVQLRRGSAGGLIGCQMD